MPQIHAPELAENIRRTYGVRGAQGFDTISPEIVPVTIVGQLGDGGRLCIGNRVQTNVAAQRAFVGLRATGDDTNRVRRVFLSALGDILRYAIMLPVEAITLTNAGGKAFQDRRLRGDPSAILSGANAANLPAGDVVADGEIPANSTIEIPLDVILSPGAAAGAGTGDILAVNQTPNQSLACTWVWEQFAGVPGDRVP